MTKKTTFIGVMAMLCLNFMASAQQESTMGSALGGLMPGDHLPEITISNVYGPASSRPDQISFGNIRGKAVILDFFATWCATCISRFPHVQTLQRANEGKLLILLVNTSGRDSDKKVTKFMKAYYGGHADFKLPYALRDSTLEQLLPTKMLPHYVWIGADGVIKAITGWEDVTASNVAKLIDGTPILAKVKMW